MTKQGVDTVNHIRFIKSKIYLYYSQVGDLMKYRFMMLLLPFMFSCSDDLSSYKGYEVDFRDKIYSDIKHVGSSCDVNCIYSNYAVKYNIQSKQYDY